MKHTLSCLYKAIVKTIDHDGVEHAGYMSFMVILSIFPFFVFLLALTSFFGDLELGGRFIEIVLDNIPSEAVDSFRDHIYELRNSPPQSLLTLAVAGTIWTASSFVECTRTILNRVYEIKSPPNYIFRRLLSIMQFLLISMAIMMAMLLFVLFPIALAKLPEIADLINGYFDEYAEFFSTTRYILLFLSLFFTASLLYYLLPNVKITFIEVAPGALLTVILWVASGYLLSKYIRFYNQLTLVYGSLGSIIVTLIFFYIINIVFIYGAEFNFLLRKKHD